MEVESFVRTNLSSRVKVVVEPAGEAVIAAAMLVRLFQSLEKTFSLTFFTGSYDDLKTDPAEVMLFIGKMNVVDVEKKFIVINDPAIMFDLARSFGKERECSGLYALACVYAKKPFPAELKIDLTEGVGLNVGLSTVPLHKLLELSLDPFLPNLSGQEDNCFSFLRECNIPIKDEQVFRTFLDVSGEERKVLFERLKVIAPVEFTSSFVMKEEGMFRDVVAWNLLIKECIDAGVPSLALGCCLSPQVLKHRVWEVFVNSRRKLCASLQWLQLQAAAGKCVEKEQVIIVDVDVDVSERRIVRFVKNGLFFFPPSKMVFFFFSVVNGKRVVVGSLQNRDLEGVVQRLKGKDVIVKEGVVLFDIAIDAEESLKQQLLALEGVMAEERVQ
ncbi:MAG: hypothetical protein WC595_02385 [Candidatus Nanoarchaeia archaeon]